jgi:hypothetical protein
MKSNTPARSLFFDDWQACLRAHYMHVIRSNDAVTEPTLRQVLLHTGLSENDLEALRQQAYALDPSAPELPPEPEEVQAVTAPPPAEEPGELTYDELGVVVDAANDDPVPEDDEAPPAEEPDEPPPDFGRQLSLF